MAVIWNVQLRAKNAHECVIPNTPTIDRGAKLKRLRIPDQEAARAVLFKISLFVNLPTKSGKSQTDRKAAFELLRNGRIRAINDRECDIPNSIGVLLDTFGALDSLPI